MVQSQAQRPPRAFMLGTIAAHSAALVAIFLAMPAAHAAGGPLGSFLAGYEKACDHPAAYTEMERSMVKASQAKSGKVSCAAQKPKLPSAIAALTASWDAHESQGSCVAAIHFSEDVAWNGLKVRGIEHWEGIDNGIQGSALILDEPGHKQAELAARRAGAQFKSVVSEASGTIKAQFVQGRDGKPRLMCDMSN